MIKLEKFYANSEIPVNCQNNYSDNSLGGGNNQQCSKSACNDIEQDMQFFGSTSLTLHVGIEADNG